MTAEPAPRYVNPAPFDVDADDTQVAPNPPGFFARLRRKRLAYLALAFLVMSYAMLPFIEIIAPNDPEARDNDRIYAPPQSVRLFHDGAFIGPFVYPQTASVNLETFKREYALDPTKPERLQFFCEGSPYHWFGLIPANLRLVCPADGAALNLMGTDRLGRDVLSRVLYGGRVSLTIGLFGVAISLVLGVLFGLLAGYLGGWIDNAIQRLIELLRSLPELPLWMALAAALPVTWSPLWVYVGITVILGLLDWPGLARAVRARVLALREEEFTVAARLMGASPWRIMTRHLAPNFSSHLIASATLAIPGMILGETALSFLGLGLRAPVTSWGVMLNEAQNLAVIEVYPWLLAPLAPVVAVILAFNLLGDGLRDAADPYARL
jgi:peptide/nickel transport system permease protein